VPTGVPPWCEGRRGSATLALTTSLDGIRRRARRPGTLHVVYADHALIDSDLSGFAHAAVEPASTPVIVTGRSHHAVHHVIGSVPVQLLHESPYPVLTIA
jgi:hypothetical protein